MSKRSRVPGSSGGKRLTKSQQRRFRKHAARQAAELKRVIGVPDDAPVDVDVKDVTIRRE